jgi:hypothetical protein
VDGAAAADGDVAQGGGQVCFPTGPRIRAPSGRRGTAGRPVRSRAARSRSTGRNSPGSGITML